MKKQLSLLMLVAALLVPWASNAQTLESYGFTTGVDSTKWVDMTGSTQILSPSGSDGLASAVQNIGFTFPFAGSIYTQYSVNTDGNLRLGSTATGTSNYTTPFNSTNANSNNPKINAFGCDGYGLGGSHYVKALTQETSDGDTMLVVEFCTGTFNSNTRNNLYKWQIHLCSDGNIDIVYAAESVTPPAVVHQCGICFNSGDGWVIQSSMNVATHFNSGSTLTNAANTWFDASRYYSFIHPNNLSCPSPTGVVVTDITPSSATISWTRGGMESSWVLEVGGVEYYPTDTVYTVTSLESNTPYDVRVRAICGSGDTSYAAMGDFRTECLSISSLPYSNDFEDEPAYSTVPYADAFPHCWTRINDATGTYNYYPYINTTSTYLIHGNQSMYWYHTTTTNYANNQYAVLPPIDRSVYNVSDLTLSFYAKTTATATPYPQFIVGVMTDPNDATTFTPLDTIDLTATATLYVVNFSGYTDTGAYIAIRSPRTTAIRYASLDDIYLTDEWCNAPESVTASANSEEVTVRWSNDDGSSFTVCLGTDTVNNITGTSYTFSNLSPDTEYEYGVSRECSSGNSLFINGTIRTECVPIADTALPYIENFEAYGTGSAAAISSCWTKGLVLSGSGTTTNFPYPYSTAAINGTRGLYFYGAKTSSVSYGCYAALPPIDENLSMSDLMVSFMVKRSTSTSSSSTTYTCRLLVGIADSLTGLGTATIMDNNVTWIDTLDYSSEPASSVHAAQVTFANYEGTGRYVVFYVPVPNNTTTSNYTHVYLDDVALRNIPSCFWPTDVALDSLTSDEAVISWTPDSLTHDPSSWVVEYGLHGFTPGTGTVESAYDTVITLYGLTPNTEYDIYISADCGGTVSDPASFTFRTTCAPIINDSLPYVEDFESYASGAANPISPCWYRKAFGTTTNYPYPNTSAASTGNIGLYGYGTNAIYEYAVLPPFDEQVGNLMLDFDLKRGTSSGTNYHTMVYIGVMSNVDDLTTFDTVELIDDSGNPTSSITHHRVSFEGYTGAGRIAILWPLMTGTTYNYAHLDNVVVNLLPDCRWPVDLAVDSVTSDGISVSFAGPEGGTFRVVISTAAGVAVDSADITTTSYSFTGLTPQTTYNIRVATLCSGEISEWTAINATTACAPIATLPWVETFDSYTATSTATNIDCWEHLGGGYVNFYTTSGAHLYSGTSLRFYPNSSMVGNVMVLPEFVDPISDLEITLMSKPEGTSSGSFSVGYVTNPTDATSFVEVQEYPISHFQLTTGSTTVSYVELQNTFAGAPANARIALRHNVGTTAWYWFIDSVDVHEAPACLPVSSLEISAYSDSSITVGFAGVAGNSFGVAIRNASGSYFDSVTITSFSHTFTGLNANTEYTIDVTAICPNGNSEASTITARTSCAPMALPYTEDFEGYGTGAAYAISPCWTKGTNNTTAYPYPFATNAIHGQRSLYFYAYQPSSATAAAYYSYAALPMMADSVKNLMLSFNVRRYGTVTDYYTTRLVVGVMTNPDEIATFEPLDTIDLKNEPALSVHGYEYSFNNYTGNGQYIAIFDPVPPTYAGNAYSYSYAYVDDIFVDRIPTCPRPTNVTINNIGSSTATVHWTSTATNFEVEYGPLGFNMGTGTTVTATGDSVDLTGLVVATGYDVYVRAICSATDQGNWSFVTSFYTECGTLAVPYMEDFESYGSGATQTINPCWTKGTSSTTAYPYPFSTNAVNGQRSLYFYAYHPSSSSTTPVYSYAALPEFSAAVNTLEMSFNVRTYSSSTAYYYTNLLVGVMTNPNDITTFTAVDTVNLQGADVLSVHQIEVSFANYTDTGKYIAIYDPVPPLFGTSTYAYSYAYVDDIFVGHISACPRSYNLQAYNGTATSVTLEWTDTIGSSQWVVEYGLLGDTATTTITVGTNPYVLTGLTANTNYRYRVAPICANGLQADWSRSWHRFGTALNPATLPYSYDFEAAAEWSNWQTASNNAVGWYRGNVANGNSTNAMYLSTDNGATHSWNMSAVTNVVAYRDIDFGTDTHSFQIEFDAYIGGTIGHNYDGVAIVVTDPANYVESSNANITSPWGHINSVSFGTVRHDTLWGHHTVYIDGVAGVKRVAFYHFNQATASSYAYDDNPPAIDNISIVQQVCERPYGLVASNATLNSVDLSWTGDATALYQIAYRVQGTTSSTNVYATTTGTSYTLTGLATATDYYWWVRKICSLTASDTTVSAFSANGAFTTLCGLVSVTDTLFEDFESITGVAYNAEGELPTCWEGYNANNTFTPHVTNGGTYSYCISGTNAVTLTSGTTTSSAGGTDNYMRLVDIVEPTNTLTVAFWMCTESSTNGFLEVGYLTGNDYTTDFVAVKRINASSATLHSGNGLQDSLHGVYDTVAFDSVPMGNYPICFRWNYTTSFYSCCIDNLSVWANISCPAPVIVSQTVDYESAAITISGTSGNYELAYGTDISLLSDTMTSTTGVFNVTGLQPSTTYHYAVRQICDSGDVSNWTLGSFVTDDLPCTVVTGLQVTNISYTSASFSWNAGADETAWEVKVASTVDSVIVTVYADSATVDSLVSQRMYNVTVRPLCGSNQDFEGPWCEPETFTTDACLPVSNVTVSDITEDGATVAWTAPEGAENFRVAYGLHDFSVGDEIDIINTSANPFALSGLDENTPYTVRVAVVCTQGLVSSYESADFTTAEHHEGIFGVDNDGALSLYPNPASTKVTLRVGEQLVGSTVSIVDVNGREVMSEKLDRRTLTIDLGEMAKGAYFVRITGERAAAVRKLIVK